MASPPPPPPAHAQPSPTLAPPPIRALAPPVLPAPAPPIPSHHPKTTIRASAHLAGGLRSLGGGGLLASARAAHDRLHFGRRRTSLDEYTQYIGVASAGRHQHACGRVLARAATSRVGRGRSPRAAIKNKQRTPAVSNFRIQHVPSHTLGQHTHIGDNMRPAPWYPGNTICLRSDALATPAGCARAWLLRSDRPRG